MLSFFCFSISQLLSLAKQLDLTERQIERWWRRRKAQDKPTTLIKFSENCWRCMYYTYSFIFGMIVMWDKSWLWDIKQCWYNYPHQVNWLRLNWLLSGSYRCVCLLVHSQRRLVVLHGVDGVLLVADLLAVLRQQAQRLLANVHPSRSHFSFDLVELDLQPAPGGIAGAARPWLRGYFARSGKVLEVLEFPEGLRYRFRTLHRHLDRHEAWTLPSHHLQHQHRGADDPPDVPGVLHLQLAAYHAAGASSDMDLHDPPDCRADHQGRPDGGRCAFQLRRRHHRQLREPGETFSQWQWNAQERTESPSLASKAESASALGYQTFFFHHSKALETFYRAFCVSSFSSTLLLLKQTKTLRLGAEIFQQV